MKTNNLNEWLKIDAKLQKKLKELNKLNKERKLLILKAEKQQELTPEMQEELEISLTKYTELANQVSELKNQARLIKEHQ